MGVRSSQNGAASHCASAPSLPEEFQAIARFPFPERDLMTMRPPPGDRVRAAPQMQLQMEVCVAPWWPGKEKYTRFNPAFSFGAGEAKLNLRDWCNKFRDEELEILRTI